MPHFSLISFIGAVAIFLYGIRVSRNGLQLLGGDRLRGFISQLTDKRMKGLLVGIFVTLILQSSSATANMLVSFAGAGLLTLTQAMGVLLGADIGTSLVVLLLSIRHFGDYAMLFLVFGVAFDFISSTKKAKYLSMILLGFGFIFLGMRLMTEQALPLKEIPLFTQLMSLLAENKGYAFVFAAFITPFLSSAGTLGLLIAFSFSGILNFEQSLPMILGANIGTCFTSVLSSISGGTSGKQVAFAHLVFKGLGVVICFLFLDEFSHLVFWLSHRFPGVELTQSGLIAFTHILFNLMLSFFFFPFVRQGVWLIEKLLPPTPAELENPFAPRYLDVKNLDTPSLAFANVRRELLRVADLVFVMFRCSIQCYEKYNLELVQEIEAKDDKVDFLDREVKIFLTKLSQENLTSEQAKLSMTLLTMTGALEEIGDIIVQNILDMAGKKIHRSRTFSEEGWKEILAYHSNILQSFSWVISALTSSNRELCHKVIRSVEHLVKDHEELRNKHLARLQSGLKESIETSSIHLDTLSAFSRIASLLQELVTPLLEMNV
ncbi:MAG: Na/Pi cotransporter family protein [Deltaproteobacteria bacterium]|nr:Na/Pi cotransporter family protein [Deltaproteobacteria bacterium]